MGVIQSRGLAYHRAPSVVDRCRSSPSKHGVGRTSGTGLIPFEPIDASTSVPSSTLFRHSDERGSCGGRWGSGLNASSAASNTLRCILFGRVGLESADGGMNRFVTGCNCDSQSCRHATNRSRTRYRMEMGLPATHKRQGSTWALHLRIGRIPPVVPGIRLPIIDIMSPRR